jgi:hypothetical protein
MADESESSTFVNQVHLAKWSEQQTLRAAELCDIPPEELTHDHFTDLGWAPEEEIRVDHATGRVIHIDSHGNRRVLHIEEWEQEEH